MTLPSLLLLPPPPSIISRDSLSSLYQPAITDVVQTLKHRPSSTELIIGIFIPHLQSKLDLPRAVIYDETQHLLAGVYSLVCAVCAKLTVDVESGTPGSVDVRVILLVEQSSREPTTVGPIVHGNSFLAARPSWDTIFFTIDDKHTQQFLSLRSDGPESRNHPNPGRLQTVGSGKQITTTFSQPTPSFKTTPEPHHVVAVGGTFDHIHAGHKLLLTATAIILQPSSDHRRLIVGITGDELLKNKKYAQFLGSWKQRQEEVVQFLLSILLFDSQIGDKLTEETALDRPVPNGKAIHTHLFPCNLTIECVEIQDPFGPTITDESVTALVVSGETRSGGQAVNEERNKKGWSSLEVFEIDVLDSGEVEDPSNTENFASKISSTAIRKRIAEGNGKPSL